jgi:hypothetical protein
LRVSARFPSPLIKPDVQISRIKCDAPNLMRELRPAEILRSCDLTATAQCKAQGKTPAFVLPEALAVVGGSPPRDINGKSAADRLSIRRQLSAPLVDELENWTRQERTRFSRHDEVAQAMNYYTCSSAGRHSSAFCTAGESASATTLANERSEETFWAGRHGCSPVRTGRTPRHSHVRQPK